MLLLVLLGLLVCMLYPALVLRCPLAPEAGLKGEAPWRTLLGPFPRPSDRVVGAATRLGPRLAMMQREGLDVAVWNPLVGGGRVGFLASAEEGGAPLALLAALASRSGWAWTALLALQLAAAFASAWWVLRLVGVSPWGAAAGALVFSLSGAVAVHWLDWRGSGLALGPLALVPALRRARGLASSVAQWAAVLFLVGLCGSPALQFVALAALLVLFAPLVGSPTRPLAALGGALLAAAVLFPGWWLERAGRESAAGAPVGREMVPALSSLTELVGPARPGSPQGTVWEADGRVLGDGALGLAALALAAAGLFAGSVQSRALWLGVGLGSLVLVAFPEAMLRWLGMSVRPYGTLALALAALAGFGVDGLLDRVREPVRPFLGCLSCGLLVWSMMPPVARGLPFASQREAVLPAPLAPAPVTQGRVVGLFGALPPDVGAAMGLADVRGAFFSGEPTYTALLGGATRNEIGADLAMSQQIASLGARHLVEPLPLSVVTGQIFASVEVADARVVSWSATAAGLEVSVPDGAGRLALRPQVPGLAVRLSSAGKLTVLPRDPTLAAESNEWTWFAVPPHVPRGPAVLVVPKAFVAGRTVVPVAWDRSGLVVAREDLGARVWTSTQARPFVFLAQPEPLSRSGSAGAGSEGGKGELGFAYVSDLSATKVVVNVNAARPAHLVVQVKHRPRLWHCTVAGRPAATSVADGVWTGVEVPAGASQVTLRAGLPAAVWSVGGLGVLTVLGLAVVGRRG